MIDGGLILEGGGMRGAYTCGALDLLHDHGLMFSSIYGVSAGSCHACSYLSGQRGRAARTVIDYAGDRRYGSVSSFLTTGDYFNVRFVYDVVPNKLLPFDYEAFRGSGARLWAVVTDLETGGPVYLPVEDLEAQMDYIRASSSLPLLSRIVRLNGKAYLDGGISDSIPLQKSIDDGIQKNLVILTQHRGYQKTPTGMMSLIKARYRRWPAFVEASASRHRRYNQALALCEAEEGAGRAVVVQPGEPVNIGRLEKDRDKLRALYELGYRDAEEKLSQIRGLFGTQG